MHVQISDRIFQNMVAEYNKSTQSRVSNFYKNVKILTILSYKIFIFAFTKIVFKGRYLEMIAPMIHDKIGNSSCIVV